MSSMGNMVKRSSPLRSSRSRTKRFLKELDEELWKPGSTIVPVIISSDQTQLTTFRNKNCYLVYVTIGNIPKEIRRKPTRQGQILLGYLPIIKLSNLTGPLAMRRRMVANIFHACMGYMLKPLEKAGRKGVHMASGDGLVHRTHPIFALHVSDYPEQLLITGCKKGECPTCPIPMDEVGDSAEVYNFHDFAQVLEAFDKLDQGLGPTAFRRACKDAGIKPIQQPYWINLPFVNIFHSIRQVAYISLRQAAACEQGAKGERAHQSARPQNLILPHVSKSTGPPGGK
ncbi:hypothetical protein K435DRAFT_866398 [Dendrothele bispora CBS 962.96]|uniref:Uncharacterized protein n=1 Tax=Dendrothele bispora (strain CBS 962.96) TaxID=1314807 RepID=A0A4S8LIA7_DENBC|nr:hypothetical protein K435DRAFT_866398 [Dendrothele bispora CBS 962.96]